MNKFKNIEDLNSFVKNAKEKKYETKLTESLSFDELDILKRDDQNISRKKYGEIKSKYEYRVGSILELICEIEGYRLSWWSHEHYEVGDQDPKLSPVIYENTFGFYLASDGVYKFYYPSMDEGELPIGYLLISKEKLVECYLNDIIKYHTKEIEKRIDTKKKKEYRNNKNISILKSIKSKISSEEFDFISKKLKLNKKQIQ